MFQSFKPFLLGSKPIIYWNFKIKQKDIIKNIAKLFMNFEIICNKIQTKFNLFIKKRQSKKIINFNFKDGMFQKWIYFMQANRHSWWSDLIQLW